MKTMKQITLGAGKVGLALLAGVLFPVLIWVALGVAVSQRIAEKRVRRPAVPAVGEILAASRS